MKTTWSLWILPLILSLSGCAHSAPAWRGDTGPTPTYSPRTDEDNLEESFARFRSSQVASVDYELSFNLKKGADSYHGDAILYVTLNRLDAPLSIDYTGQKIEAFRINDTAITDFSIHKGSIEIPVSRLSQKMKIEVVYTNLYNSDGQGMQKAIDPEDSSEYVFTDFEPNYAHELFPCFDQPNLKATYRVSVEGPSDWKIIANDLVESTTAVGDRVLTRFAKSKPFSTYLFFLGAGPFVEWKDQLGQTPLYVYARKTLAKYVDADRIFDTTKKGLSFYNDYFGYEYPFPKFGMIFIPEFAWGGMENPGAIAMNESMIFRGAVSQSTLDRRENTILHEMAHMWFGDLVTMQWWNDLWLNESFASYVSSLNQARGLQNRAAWQDLFNEKTWGYWQDQLVTTHPIEVNVTDVKSSKSNFDGITYAKGAASLKQLHFFTGDEGFRSGLRSYFHKFAFKNTTRADFINEIARASDQNLGDWTHAWLQTAGLNRVQAQWSCSDGKVNHFSIVQAPSASQQLSPHRTRVALYKAPEGGPWQTMTTANVTYTAAETQVPALIGSPCPDFVYPNEGDEDYALFALDPVSLKYVKNGLTGGIRDPLLRTMVWSTLSQMVRDSQLPVQTYFEIILAGLAKETDPSVLSRSVLEYQVSANYFHFLTSKQRRRIGPELENVVWNRVKERSATGAGDSLLLTFFDFYLSIAQSRPALKEIHGFLQGHEVPAGLTVDQDRRWAVIHTLAREGYPGVSTLIDSEEKRDHTTTGKRAAFTARASMPSLMTKWRYWAEFQKSDKIPFSILRSAAGAFHLDDHPELSKAFVKPFFSVVKTIDWNKNDHMVEIYLEKLFPGNLCSEGLLTESQTELASAKNLVPLAKRAWLESNDELSRCISVRKTSAAAEIPVKETP